MTGPIFAQVIKSSTPTMKMVIKSSSHMWSGHKKFHSGHKNDQTSHGNDRSPLKNPVIATAKQPLI